MKTVVFYISSHGYGHLTRCLAVIGALLKEKTKLKIYVKCLESQIPFAKNYLKEINYGNREGQTAVHSEIIFDGMHTDVGTLVYEGSMEIDREKTIAQAKAFTDSWQERVQQEEDYFSKREKPDVIVADIVPWAFLFAEKNGIYSIAISNFTWLDTYKTFMPEAILQQYKMAYEQADLALAYEFAMESLHSVFKNSRQISLIARDVNLKESRSIRERFLKKSVTEGTHCPKERPIVYISIGKLVSVSERIDVSHLPYQFIITEGLDLQGDNVFCLGLQDHAQNYLYAADYVITKPGWSTTAEALLAKKPLGLINRRDSEEDRYTLDIILRRKQCVKIEQESLHNMEQVLEDIKQLPTDRTYEYQNDASLIAGEILNAMN